MKRDQIPDQNFEKKVIFGKMIQHIFLPRMKCIILNFYQAKQVLDISQDKSFLLKVTTQR